MPTIGTPGPRAARISATLARATPLIHSPDFPPFPPLGLPRTARPLPGSRKTSGPTVLTALMASAPAATAARAIGPMAATLGVSLATRGRGVARRMTRRYAATVRGSWPMAAP